MAKTTKKIQRLISKIVDVAVELEMLADDIEAVVMKKTTQRSPEFRGGADC